MTLPEITLTSPVGPPDAPLVVLGPSLGTSTILWEDVIPALAAEFRVIAWDLPGHGSSPAASAPFTVADLADAVVEGVRSQASASLPLSPASRPLSAVEGFLYAGVSLGGATGLTLALRHPSLVRRAAIIASGAKLGEAAGWHERAAQVRAQSTSSVIIGSAQRWFAPDSIARRPDISGRLLHALQDADDESYALCCEALADYDVRGSLGEIGMPVLAVWGSSDLVAPETKSAEIVAGVASGSILEISDAAHLPPAEQPRAVASALLDFFQEER